MSNVSHELEQLPNGSQLCFVNVEDVEAIQMDVVFDKAGEFYAPDGLWETAHVTEHMILQGCKQYPNPRDFRDAIEGNGAYANAYTHRDSMRYSLQSPTAGSETAISAYLSAIEAPLFKAKVLQKEKNVVREELTGYLGMRVWMALEHVHDALDLPEVPMVAHLMTLDDITPANLHRHHQDTHSFDTMTTVITGNLSDKAKQRFVGMLQGMSLSPTAQVVDIVPQPFQQDRLKTQFVDDNKSIYYYIGNFGVASNTAEDTVAHEVATNLLYRYPRSSVMSRAREKGLIYAGEGGWNVHPMDSYGFTMEGEVSAANAPSFCKLVRNAIAGALELDDEETFAQVKRYTVGSRQLYMHDIEAVHGKAAHELRRFGKIRNSGEIDKAFEQLDLPTYQEAIRRGLTGGITTGALVAEHSALNAPGVAEEFQKTFDYLGRL